MPVLIEEEYSSCGVISKTLDPFVYQIEVWGADGGSFNANIPGGKGGYSSGVIAIKTKTQIFIHLGEKGSTSGLNACNGGGKGTGGAKGGGGATDVRVEIDDLYHRIIVGGGGGGASDGCSGDKCDFGGFGGGTNGGNGGSAGSYANGYPGKGANQTSETTLCRDDVSGCPKGTFGYGGNAIGSYAGGGGGGFYGGSASIYETGGGGGSGYALSPTSPIPNDYFKGYRNYYFINSTTLGGNEAFPRPSSDGQGFIKIIHIVDATFLQYSNPAYLQRLNTFLKSDLPQILGETEFLIMNTLLPSQDSQTTKTNLIFVYFQLVEKIFEFLAANRGSVFAPNSAYFCTLVTISLDQKMPPLVIPTINHIFRMSSIITPEIVPIVFASIKTEIKNPNTLTFWGSVIANVKSLDLGFLSLSQIKKTIPKNLHQPLCNEIVKTYMHVIKEDPFSFGSDLSGAFQLFPIVQDWKGAYNDQAQ